MGWITYLGYEYSGPGWLLIGWPFTVVAVLVAQTAITFIFPPKLKPYAEGSTWLKLT